MCAWASRPGSPALNGEADGSAPYLARCLAARARVLRMRLAHRLLAFARPH